MTRTSARDAAVRLLYEREMGGDADLDGFAAMTDISVDGEERAYIEDVLGGVSARLLSLDALIEQNAKNWSLERIARVDLCILRVAVYELLCRLDVPQAAAINEAVELARTYGGEDSVSFVNGVLGAISRSSEVESARA